MSRRSIMRSLGEFVGHVVKAIKTDPAAPDSTTSAEVEESTHETPIGRVTLRRTTIEEMRVEPTPPGADAPPPGADER